MALRAVSAVTIIGTVLNNSTVSPILNVRSRHDPEVRTQVIPVYLGTVEFVPLRVDVVVMGIPVAG